MTTRSTRPSSPTRQYTVVGGGAIGGTLAFHLARAGHPVLIVDTDENHVAALNERGLTLRGPDGAETVPVTARTPNEAGGPWQRVLLCVKAGATDTAAGWLAPHLTPDGFVVSLQNGLNEERIAAHVGAERTVAAFVNLFADVVAPGVVRDGGTGALVVGETDGRTTARVTQTVHDLQAWGPARATDNVPGYLWSKLGFGAILTATAVVDAPMADVIDAHRPLMHALAGEVLAVATALGLTLEPFDAWDPAAYLPAADPAERAAATDRLVAWLRTMPKDRSGIWRDIVVRKRPVEVPHHYRPVLALAEQHGVATPLLAALLDQLIAVESGRRTMSEHNLTDLEAACSTSIR